MRLSLTTITKPSANIYLEALGTCINRVFDNNVKRLSVSCPQTSTPSLLKEEADLPSRFASKKSTCDER